MHHSPTSPAGEAQVFGLLDTCSPNGVSGWAYNKTSPAQRPHIVCFVDGHEVAQGQAHLPRPDLQQLGLGDGKYGFSVALPRHLVDNQHHLLEVKARIDGTDHPLRGGSRLMLFNAQDELTGHVVLNNDGLVHGWALNKGRPETPVEVTLSAGPGHELLVEAKQYRPDLAALQLGTGHHGFQAVVPWHWYNAARNGILEITVTAHPTGAPLPGSPLALNLAQSYKTRIERDEAQPGTAAPLQPPPKVLVSVVMPVYNPPETYLQQAIESVLNQTHPHWQLCIADDASPNPAIRALLQRYASEDPRIQVVFREQNGNISRASNSALALAKGSHFALLDHDDLLHPDALLHVAHAIHANPGLGIIFSNEDKCTADNQRFGPYFKPGWDRELLLSQNCVSHLGVFRTDLARQLGGFRPGYEGSQDYDLALRASRHLSNSQILHIPRVLYHWRAIPGSTALANTEKHYAVTAMRKALQSHLGALKLKADIQPAHNGVFFNVLPKLPAKKPSLTLLWVIAPNTPLASLNAMLHSLQHWPALQWLLALPAECPVPPALQPYLAQNHSRAVHYTPSQTPLPHLLQALLQHATGDLCLCITEPVTPSPHQAPNWLHTLAAHALRKHTGVVCPRLHDASLNTLYAGYKANPTLTPQYTGLHINDPGDSGAAILNRETDALLPALFMARTQVLAHALAHRPHTPGTPWHLAACTVLKEEGKISRVVANVLFQQDDTALPHPATWQEPVWFSIILPTHNRKARLARAIDSVLAQHHPHFELIIVDDGSTDGTDTLIRTRYAQELNSGKVVYARHTPNRGVSYARNAGLECARHPWIAYADSDNRLRPGFLAQFAQAITRNPGKTTYYAHFQNESGSPIVGKPFSYAELQHANYIDLGVFVHARRLTDTLGGFDTELKRLVDWDLILRLTCHNPPVYLPHVVLDYNDLSDTTDRISVRESFGDARQHLRQKGLI